MVWAGNYESATPCPIEPESPIKQGFQPSPTLARPVLSRKLDQCSHPLEAYCHPVDLYVACLVRKRTAYVLQSILVRSWNLLVTSV